jgi:hypothetical protein
VLGPPTAHAGSKRRDVFFVANWAADHRSGNLALILNA